MRELIRNILATTYDENIFSLMAMLLISLWKVYRKYGCGAAVDSRVRVRRYWQYKYAGWALLHHSISPDPGCLRISGITILWWWTSQSRRSGKISCVMEIKHQALSGTLFFKMMTHVSDSSDMTNWMCMKPEMMLLNVENLSLSTLERVHRFFWSIRKMRILKECEKYRLWKWKITVISMSWKFHNCWTKQLGKAERDESHPHTGRKTSEDERWKQYFNDFFSSSKAQRNRTGERERERKERKRDETRTN